MLRRFLPLVAAISFFALSGCGSNVVAPASAQSSGTPGTVSVSWTAATQNTDNSPIQGTITYTAYEMTPCQTATACASDATILATSATGISGTSVQISNVTDGLHCYTVQTNVVLPNGANVSSALAPLNFVTDGTGSCIIVSGSSTPQPTPNAPSAVKVT